MRWGRALTLSAMALCAALATACSPLGAFNALVPKDRVGAVERDVAYGPLPRQRLDLYAPPPGAVDGAAPVIVFVHGGSWASGSKDGYAWAGRALASRGYLVAVPNYRLVPEVRYDAFVADTAAAIAWVQSNAGRRGGDPARLAVAGHSAGAYNALQAVLALEFLRRAGGDPDGVRALIDLSGPTDFLPLDTDSTIAAFGNVPPRALPHTQPVNRVAPGAPPLLIVHGTDDDTVEPRHARAMADAARAVGARVDLHLLEGVDHRGTVLGLSRPFRGRVPTLELIDAFLKDVL